MSTTVSYPDDSWCMMAFASIEAAEKFAYHHGMTVTYGPEVVPSE